MDIHPFSLIGKILLVSFLPSAFYTKNHPFLVKGLLYGSNHS